jgi:hypothetical protein
LKLLLIAPLLRLANCRVCDDTLLSVATTVQPKPRTSVLDPSAAGAAPWVNKSIATLAVLPVSPMVKSRTSGDV